MAKEIGPQIRERRLELNMTQDMLAKELNVSRSAVANWEIGRNYPDIQMIVQLSNVLELSLDTLLKEESTIVKEIARDTQVRKLQSKKIKLLSASIIVILLVGLFGVFKSREYQTISLPNQVVSVEVYEDRLEVVTNLPFYRSVIGYTIGNSDENQSVIELSLSSQIDLSMSHKQKIIVSRENMEEDMGVQDIKKVDIVGTNGTIKSFNF